MIRLKASKTILGVSLILALLAPTGIGLAQDPIEYGTHTWHTNLDSYERVVEDDLQKGAIVVAAAMGATAFQKGLGAIHSLSHPVGALYDTHHGIPTRCSCPTCSPLD